MIETGSLAVFVAASLALLLVPGPAVLYIVARSIDQGRTAGLVSVMGIQLGAMVHVLAAAVGLSAILVSSALAFTVVKYLGAAYLLYLGISTLMKPTHTLDPATPPKRQSLQRVFRQGIIVNVLNPKTALFFFAFLPQFVDPSHGAAGQIILLGLLFIGLAMCTDGTYAVVAGTLGQMLKSSQTFLRAQKYLSGGTYLLLGVTTAVSGSHSSK